MTSENLTKTHSRTSARVKPTGTTPISNYKAGARCSKTARACGEEQSTHIRARLRGEERGPHIMAVQRHGNGGVDPNFPTNETSLTDAALTKHFCPTRTGHPRPQWKKPRKLATIITP